MKSKPKSPAMPVKPPTTLGQLSEVSGVPPTRTYDRSKNLGKFLHKPKGGKA